MKVGHVINPDDGKTMDERIRRLVREIDHHNDGEEHWGLIMDDLETIADELFQYMKRTGETL